MKIFLELVGREGRAVAAARRKWPPKVILDLKVSHLYQAETYWQ